MSKTLRILTTSGAVALLLGLAACVDFRSDEARIAPVKSIGIISAIGDHFTVTHAGLTGPTTGDRSIDIARWGLDADVERRATALLGSRFTVVSVGHSLDARKVSDEPSMITPVNLFREDAIKGVLRETKRTSPVDAYVVILEATSPVGPGGRTVRGIGALQTRTLTDSRLVLHALYQIKVFDGRTLDLLEARGAAPLEGAGLSRLAGPSTPLDPAAIETGDPAGNQTIREGVTALFAQSLARTLGNLHLTAGAATASAAKDQ